MGQQAVRISIFDARRVPLVVESAAPRRPALIRAPHGSAAGMGVAMIAVGSLLPLLLNSGVLGV